MRVLSLSLPTRLTDFALFVMRVMVGAVIFAHGEQKLTIGPTALGEKEFYNLGIPLAVPIAYVTTFAELFGGLLLIVGLLSRVTTLVLLLDRIAALFFGKVYLGRFVAYLLLKVTFESVVPKNYGVGVELDLMLVAGLLVILLAGPGKFSFDYALGFERDVDEEPSEQETHERNTR